MSDVLKIIFVGPPGAGKSTAIRAISDHPPVSTDVPASDESRLTTVALDFGEMALDDGEVLRLYGVPGQGRFEFIWPIISEGAIGALFFIDARHPTPLDVLDGYLESFADTIRQVTSLLVITHGDHAAHGFDSLKLIRHIRSKGLEMNITQIDPRQRTDVLFALNMLLESLPNTATGARDAA
ncbi:GTP-binding protein [Lysobacter pythonis]|uniref:GTP-binding protein n=1 Tax=Solilutibacter pythonis TaxID=2483112 RepID=A0A3M2HT12_9GAMM|nr:GTP-binding protein [Lysobacter pythonis]RMH92891.1 GTP-binding protein [Lysobacter pythonis]